MIARNLLFHPFRILGTLRPGKEGVQGEDIFEAVHKIGK